MKPSISRCLFILLLLLPLLSHAGDEYYPPYGSWQRSAPEDVGMDAAKLVEAIMFAQRKAITEPKEMAKAITNSFSPREPDFRILGPTKPREESAGLIIRKGYIVAEWGDLERVDMTFSVVKSYLSTVMALALRDGLIDDVHSPVSRWVRDGIAGKLTVQVVDDLEYVPVHVVQPELIRLLLTDGFRTIW